MDINFDSELLWDIWSYFIVYGTIVIFGLSFLRKLALYGSLKKNLGINYKTLPFNPKRIKWRKILTYFMLFLSLIMLLFTVLKMESFLYFIPVLFVSGIIYLNGKLKVYFFDTLSTFFYSEKGFCFYPGKNGVFSLRLIKWDKIENIKIIDKKSTQIFKIKIKGKKKFTKIIAKKDYSDQIKAVFEENGIITYK